VRRGEREGWRGPRGLHSQSRCFFLGPMISWVVALHTVLDTAEPVTLCWAAVIRSVRLWPDISAAPPPPLPLGSRRGPGPPSAQGPPPLRTPYPHRLPARLPAWGGAQGRALPPARRELARVPRGVRHDVGRSLAPASVQPNPSLVSWSPAGQEGQAAAGKWRRQAPPRSFPGCPGSRDSGAAPSPAPFPFPLLLDARPPSLPRLLGEGRAGRRPRVMWWNPPGGRNRRPAGGRCAAGRVT
jgi:hypothetical protein